MSILYKILLVKKQPETIKPELVQIIHEYPKREVSRAVISRFLRRKKIAHTIFNITVEKKNFKLFTACKIITV